MRFDTMFPICNLLRYRFRVTNLALRFLRYATNLTLR